MGNVNNLLPTKQEVSTTAISDPHSHEHEHEIQILESLSDITGKINTNNLAITAGSKLRVIAIKDSTFNDLRELAGQTNNRETYDSIVRKCVEALRRTNKKSKYEIKK